MKKVFLFLKKGFLEIVNYRFSFIFHFFAIFITIGIWYYITKFVKGTTITSKLYGGDYFSFVLIGVAFYRYVSVGIHGVAVDMMKEIERGTLESNWATSTRPFAIAVYSSLWSFIYATFHIVLFLLIARFVFGINLNMKGFSLLFLVGFLTIFCYIAIGIILDSFILIFKRPEPMDSAITLSFLLFGGVYFPISVFPSILQKLSLSLPITYSLNATRKVLLNAATISDISTDLIMLMLFIFILTPISILIFNYAVRRNRLSGSLTFY